MNTAYATGRIQSTLKFYIDKCISRNILTPKKEMKQIDYEGCVLWTHTEENVSIYVYVHMNISKCMS